MRRILPALVIATLVSVSACSADSPSPASPAQPAPATAAPVPASTAPVVDVHAVEVCRLVSLDRADPYALMKDGRALKIEKEAEESTDEKIQAKGQEVADRFRNAVLAKGTDDEFSTSAQLVTAGTQLSTICIEAGLDP
jgi:hypothetical protein